MPEIESKGRGCRNFESRAKDKPFEERRRNQKTNVWRFPNFHLHIAGNCLNECQTQTLSLSDPSLAARGMAEFAADSHQFGNGFPLDLRNSPINFRIVGRRWWSVSTSSPDRSGLPHTTLREPRRRTAEWCEHPSVRLDRAPAQTPPIP